MNIFCIKPKGYNVGNDTIFLGLKELIQSSFNSFVNIISLPATSKYETSARSGLTSKTIHEINQYGQGVIIGGGNLYENGELDVNINALEHLEPPLMIFSLSRGRIYNYKNKLITRSDVMPESVVKALNKKSIFSLARDMSTYKYLHSLGIKNAELGGCPTIYLDKIQHRLPEVMNEDKDLTLISVRNPVLMNISLLKQSEIQNDIYKIIEILKQNSHVKIRLLCHDHRDIPFAASFKNVPYMYVDEPLNYLSLLKNCRLNITYRVHSALPCMAFKTPFIKLSYDERAISLMETLGFKEWNINIVNTNDLIKEIKYRLDNLDKIEIYLKKAKKIWLELKTTQENAMKRFAKAAKLHSLI